ncbi:calponin homology domain-containing protein DDB_G0272472-like isoform X1 [Myzus persicae]|uniref:calponin homology domain-containing protein DDB_G0272472-like isoform X1 n=2 Tax=Myzus persicae TaxID=13164 RepID=UPI000B938E04|nr:calponin homology domain-containing protein DDB_G0272472-like isoform X1 [Myzus persicae]
MECNKQCEISNAVMIESLDTIIQQESRKLEMDKNTGLLAKKSKVMKVQQQSLKENENMFKQNLPIFKTLKNHSPELNQSCDRVNEIERLANLFTQSPSFFTKDNSNNCIDVKHNQVLLKDNMPITAHNEVNKYKAKLINSKNTNNLIYPGIKVRRNVRFGEYSPLNPANQVDSQPFLGIGEYDDKKKKLLELQRKEYVEYLSKVKQDKNTSDLPKLAGYSCEEAYKTAMENNNSSDLAESKEGFNQKVTIQRSTFIDGAESCASDEERKKETNRLKQELYRFDLSKQIEEKKRLELEQKRKDQLEDEAIERMAREQEEKMKMEFEKENEKRVLAQLQKQLQQEKLKNEIMQKQKDLESKSWNMPSETVSRQLSKHTSSRHESFEDNDTEEFQCPPQSTFDNVPLPTTRVRAPRKIVYDEDDKSVNRKTLRDVSCNTDTFKNPCMNQNISPPGMSHKAERAHVTFANDPPMSRTEYNPAALLPVTKSVIIDSPFTLALAGLRDNEEDNRTCEAIEPTEAAYRNQESRDAQLENSHELPTDKHLLSNLGNIRKQLVIEHQKLKQQVRRSQ